MIKWILPILALLMVSAAVAQDWPMVNYDPTYSRNSPQTTISKDNINQLQVKWILNTPYPIEDPALIVGTMGYVQNNAMQVVAFDLNTGLNVWTFDPNIPIANSQLPRATISHGINYENGVVYAPTGPNGTIVALDAKSGKKNWESPIVQPNSTAFRISAPPLIWKNLVIAGSALGDEPPFGLPQKGTVTGLDKATGKILWQTNLTEGAWVTGANASKNGGATTWSGGAIDMDKGIVYLPVGNAAPDLTSVTRPGYNNYTSNVIAVNLTDGKILWHTAFVAKGTVLKNMTAAIPDVHDYDTAFGTNLVTVNTPTGPQKIVIGHDKRGDIAGLNATTGELVWQQLLGVVYRDFALPAPNGSGVVWPGTQMGVEDFTATDNNTVYAAVSNQGVIYYLGPGLSGHVVPAFDAMPNGIGNGSIYALDLATGNIKWEHKTDFPTWVSPLVTNGMVITGHITGTGKPYEYNDFAAATKSPLLPSGILMALDAQTGQTIWEFNMGAPITLGGPSIGNGMLIVGVGAPNEVGSNNGGYIVGFGLPSASKPSQNLSMTATQFSNAAIGQMANQTMTVSAAGGVTGYMPGSH